MAGSLFNTDEINPTVFFASSGVIACSLFFSLVFSEQAVLYLNAIQTQLLSHMSWFYLLGVALLLICSFFLIASRFGDIKLGELDSQPKYSFTAWVAMLFSAGMGIGLVFFAVAEPVMHFTNPPIQGLTAIHAAKKAMEITFFHWGIHAWAIYAITGLSLAFFAYRKKLPLRLRSALYPFIGEKIYGPIGDIVDTFAICSTLFGIATSLGYGALQLSAGISFLSNIQTTASLQVIIICVVTLLALISLLAGLDKGIKTLSQFNLYLACLFLIAVLLLGPTGFLFKAFVQNIGQYASAFVFNTFNLYAYQSKEWIGGWTIFYWAWWIAWSPFVGMFIAQISHGRTIREFLLGVLFVPALLTFIWMTVFGNTAIHELMQSNHPLLTEQLSTDKTLALFYFLKTLPYSQIMSSIAMLLLVVFFVTSSDSGSYVIDTLSTKADILPTKKWTKIYWVCLEGATAAILLSVGGLAALQTATLIAALPFLCFLLLACVGLLKSLKQEYTDKTQKTWQERLELLQQSSNYKYAESFLNLSVYNACQQLSYSFLEKNMMANIEKSAEQVTFHIPDENFSMRFALLKQTAHDKTIYQIIIKYGSTESLLGYHESESDIIHRILDQYETHSRQKD